MAPFSAISSIRADGPNEYQPMGKNGEKVSLTGSQAWTGLIDYEDLRGGVLSAATTGPDRVAAIDAARNSRRPRPLEVFCVMSGFVFNGSRRSVIGPW